MFFIILIVMRLLLSVRVRVRVRDIEYNGGKREPNALSKLSCSVNFTRLTGGQIWSMTHYAYSSHYYSC